VDGAISEYEGLVTFQPESRDRHLVHPRYHYRLAGLYEEKGLWKKAAGQYRVFLHHWKEADRDLPELADAEERLAKLPDRD